MQNEEENGGAQASLHRASKRARDGARGRTAEEVCAQACLHGDSGGPRDCAHHREAELVGVPGCTTKPLADREIVLEAVEQTWKALQHAATERPADHEIVLEAVKQNGTSSSGLTPSRGAAEPWRPQRSRYRAHAFVLDAGAQEGLALAAATKPRAGQRGGSRGPRQQMQGVRGIGRVATWSLNRAYYRTLVPPS